MLAVSFLSASLIVLCTVAQIPEKGGSWLWARDFAEQTWQCFNTQVSSEAVKEQS